MPIEPESRDAAAVVAAPVGGRWQQNFEITKNIKNFLSALNLFVSILKPYQNLSYQESVSHFMPG
jgi:hypothetical protein